MEKPVRVKERLKFLNYRNKDYKVKYIAELWRTGYEQAKNTKKIPNN